MAEFLDFDGVQRSLRFRKNMIHLCTQLSQSQSFCNFSFWDRASFEELLVRDDTVNIHQLDQDLKNLPQHCSSLT